MDLKDALVAAADGGEQVVAPDDLSAVDAEDGHGQRKMHQRMLGSVVYGKGYILHIFSDLRGAAAGPAAVKEINQRHQQKLCRAHRPADLPKAHGAKQQHHHEGDPRAGFDDPGKSLVQSALPPSGLTKRRLCAIIMKYYSMGALSSQGEKPRFRGKISVPHREPGQMRLSLDNWRRVM